MSSLLHGVDVHARYQSGFNIKNVPNVDFVITKCSGGTSFTIPNWSTMLADAELTGVYHYAREKGYAGTAKEEAENFISQAQNAPEDANLFLDWEESTNTNLGDSDWILTWLQTVEAALGRKPLLYTYEAVLKAHANLSTIRDAGYQLWYARYPYSTAVGWQNYSQPTASNWGKPIMWQYSSAGMIDGWQKALDLNIFYGSKEDWLALSGSQIHVETENYNKLYVASGDKVYQANMLFGTYQEVSSDIETTLSIEDETTLGVKIQ